MKNLSKYILSVLLLFVAMETIAADVVFNSNTTLTTNVEYDNVTISAGVTLTVNAGVSLIVNGDLVVSGTLANNGTVNVSKNMSTESANSRVSGGVLCFNGDGKQRIDVSKQLIRDYVGLKVFGNVVGTWHDDVTTTTFSVNKLIIDNRSDYDSGNDGVHIEGEGVLMTNALEMQNGIVYTKTVSTKERAGAITTDDFVTLGRANLRVTGTSNSLQSANVMSFVDGPLTVTIAGRSSVRCPIGDDGASGYCELRNDESSNRHYQLSYINGFPQGGSGNEYILKGYWLIGHPDLDSGTGSRDPKVSGFKLRLGVYHENLMQLYYRQESTGEWVAQDAAQFNQDVFLGNYAGLSTSKNAPQIPGGTQFAIGVKSNITSECSGYETVNYVLSTEYEDGNSYVWTGAQGNRSWNSPYNWLGGEVPTGNSDVIIKTKYKTPKITLVTNNGCEFTTMVSGGEEMAVATYPTISNKYVKVNSLSISGGDDSNKSMLTLYDGSVTLYVNHSFYVNDKCRINCRQAGTEYGNLYVGGSLELDEDVRLTYSNALIEKNLKCHYQNVRGNRYEFVGNENSTIEFIGDENRSGYIYDLILNKSSDDLTLTVTSQNLYIGHQTAYNGSLTLNHGVLKCPNVCMNGNSTVTAENENSYVIGSFKRSSAGLNGNVIFPIGNEKRSAYLRMNILDNSSNADITVSFKNQKYTVAGGTGLYESLGDEYWTVNTGGKRVTADVLLKYDPAISNVDFANGKNIVAANLETAKNWIQVASGESSFGANYREMKNLAFQTNPVFAFAAAPSVTEAIWLGRVDDDWFNIHNWKYFAAPNASRNTYVGINGTEGSSVALSVYPNINKNKTAEVSNLNIGTPESTGVTVTNGGLSIGHDLNIKSGDLINRATMAITNLANIGDSESPKATLTNSGIATFGQNMVIDGDVINAGTMSLNGGVDYVKSNGSFVNNGSAVIRGVLEVQGGSIENNAALAADKYMSMASGSTFSGSGDTSFGTLSGNAIINSGGIVNVSGIISVAADIETNSGGEFNVATLNMVGTGKRFYNHVGGTSHIGTLNINNGGSGLNIQYGNIEVDNLLMNNGVIELNSAINNNIWVKTNLDCGGDDAYIDGMLYRTLPGLSSDDKKDYSMQYLFPVGDNGVIKYAKIGPNSDNIVVGVEYINSKYTPAPSGQANLDVYSTLGDEHWKVVSMSGQPIDKVYVTFNYDNSSNYEEVYKDYYTIADYDGSKWNAYKRDEANNKVGINESDKVVYYKTGIDVSNNQHVFALGYTQRVEKWTGAASNLWNDPANWSNNALPTKLALIADGSSNYPVIGNGTSASLTNVVVQGDDATLTIDGGTLNTDALTVTDNTNPGHVIINQHYDQSSNLIFGSTNYNGKFTINRTLKQNVLHYLGSATAEGTLTGFNSGAGDYMANYNAATEDYDNVSGSPLFPANWYGTSIGLKHSGAEIQQVGTIATGSVSMAAPLKSASDWYGWNLLSNPYQVAFDMTKSFVTFDHVEPVMWFRSFDDGSKTYRYTTYSVVARVEVSQGKPGEEPVKNLAPQQAFFVRTTSPYATPRVVFNAPTSDLIVAAGTKLKAEKVADDLLRLTVGTDGAAYDEMAIVFRNGGSMMATQNDALKRFENSSYNQIYAVKDGNSYAIPFYPMADDVASTLIPIGVQLASGAEEGVITATNIDQFNASDVVLLHDFETGAVVDLREVSEYQFVASAGQRINDRFAISLKSLYVDDEDPEEGTATGVGQAWTNSIMIVQNDNRDAIVSVPTEMLTNAAVVNVYDMAGKLVKKQNLEQTKTVVSLGDKKGVYVVEAVSGNTTERQKLRK